MQKRPLKTLVTAGSEGIGKELVDFFGPGAQSLSRRNGYDIRDGQVRKNIAKLSLDCDIFLNHAYSRDLSQVHLLEEVCELWKQHDKSGYIFSTGTYGTHRPDGIHPIYIQHKKALDEISHRYSLEFESGVVNFRVTLIRPGMLDTPRSRNKPHWRGNGVRGHDIGNLILSLYNLPKDVQISDFVIESQRRPNELNQ